MYRLNDIIKGLSGLVGWRQSRSLKKTIDPTLTVSDSGLYFQEAHPLLTLDSMRAVMPEDMADGFEDWVSSKEYAEGDMARHSGEAWRASSPNAGSEPGNSPCWEKADMLSIYLRDVTRAGIVKVVQTFMAAKTGARETRSILENKTLFDGAGRFDDIVPNRGCLVGFEITPARQIGITLVLNRIGLQMRGAKGRVKLYLFRSSNRKPLASWDVDFDSADGDFIWADFDPMDFDTGGKGAASMRCDMRYISSSNDGGSYYLVYHQSELPKWMDAINYARDWSRGPCMTCNRGDAQVWRELTRHARISPFKVKCDSFPEDHSLWNLADMAYTPETNYGINFEYTIGCDVSDFIISQRDVFASAIQLQVAYTALKTVLSNPDVNVSRRQVNAAQLLYDLDGDLGGRPSGISHELSKAYKALEIDTRGMSKDCLGCSGRSVIYGVM